MKFRGREIDAIALWSNYVEFPPDVKEGGFLPLVQCPNPNHDTMKRHFQINSEQPLVHCFAECGISGTWEHAIQMIEGCSRAEARRAILRHHRVGGGKRSEIRTRRKEPTTLALPDLSVYTFLPQAALDYLASRGVSSASISRWELGWNPETLRITIPARDHMSHLRFVIERAVKPNDSPRYLYTEGCDKKSLLFGACHADLDAIRSWGVILVEGSLDAIRLDQHGVGPVMAILGSSISDRQMEILAGLRPKRVYSMFDLDATGVQATFSLRRHARRVPVLVCRYPKGFHDPAELSREEAKRVINKAIPFSTFQARAARLMRGV